MKVMKFLIPVIGMLLISVFYTCKKSSPKPTPPDLPPVNLIAYWPLNNNADDASRYGNNGTAYNVTPVPDRFGKANSAFYFNGQDGYILVPDIVALRLANTDFTVNAWIKLDSYSLQNASAIISKRISGADHGWLWAINGQGNTPVGSVYFSSGDVSVGTKVLATGQWYMVSCVYNLAAKSLSIYINGKLDHTDSRIEPPSASIASGLYIGRDELYTGENEYYFKGALDEIRIYNIALDLPSIQSLYNSPQ